MSAVLSFIEGIGKSPPHGGNATTLAPLFMKFPTATIEGVIYDKSTPKLRRPTAADCSAIIVKYTGPSGSAVTRATGNAASGSCRFRLDTRPMKSAEEGALYIKYSADSLWSRWSRSVQAAPGRRSSVYIVTGKHFVDRPGTPYIH